LLSSICGVVCLSVCVSVCLSVYGLQVKVHEQSSPNFTHRWKPVA